MKLVASLLATVLAVAPLGARADITVGVVLSLTGPAASLGIPEKNTVDLLPQAMAGQKVRYVVLDDASDTTTAVRSARKLIDEEKVDVIIGPSVTPTSLALLEVVGPAQTPMISLAGSGAIVLPPVGARRWAFKLAPNEPTMGAYIFDDMAKAGRRTLAHIGFNDSFGESFIKEMDLIAAQRGVKVVASERYNRNDTSVTAQVLKIIAAKPDAVIVAASGTPGATPVIELKNRGYRGQVYLQQGIANSDFLRVGGKALDGALFPVSPVLVAEQLDDANPIKKVAVDYVTKYEARHGQGSRTLFGATAWDAFLLIEQAVPSALQAGQPGSAAFRTGLRDNIEKSRDFVGTQGVFTMSATDHNGTDMRSQVLVRIADGKWVYVK